MPTAQPSARTNRSYPGGKNSFGAHADGRVFPTRLRLQGFAEIDLLLHGGFPVGALSEMVGPECSGRTSLALTFVAGMTQAGKVCAWVDVSDTLHPESAAAMGVDLSRLLWIRCGRLPLLLRKPQCADCAWQKNHPR